ncbi:MAG: hypothetical protein KGQ67_08125 [Betaproteobacteria bacterium]|nr:hypothetical protein [Betaproteobacteria bacterium]
MGRRLIETEGQWHPALAAASARITLYAAKLGRVAADASALRQALQPSVPARTWHRVCPYLPREVLADGSLVLWHPDDAGWALALEQVHRLCAPSWRLSGAYVAIPGTERVEPRDFHAFDEIDLPDWSLAVPDPGFADMLGHLDGNAWRLSELIARWALQVGPARAGKVLLGALPQDPPSQH